VSVRLVTVGGADCARRTLVEAAIALGSSMPKCCCKASDAQHLCALTCRAPILCLCHSVESDPELSGGRCIDRDSNMGQYMAPRGAAISRSSPGADFLAGVICRCVFWRSNCWAIPPEIFLERSTYEKAGGVKMGIQVQRLYRCQTRSENSRADCGTDGAASNADDRCCAENDLEFARA